MTLPRSAWPAMVAIVSLAAALRPTDAPGQEPAPPEPLRVVWKRKAPRLLDLAVNGGGTRVLGLTANGSVTCYDESGEPRWQHRFPGVDSLAMSSDGSVSLAYTRLSALQRQVYFMRDDGRWFATLDVDAPIVSASIRPDGAYAALCAGPAVVLCELLADEVHTRVASPAGTPARALFARGTDLYVATRNPDRVSLIQRDGRVLWSHSRPGLGRFSISASEDGGRVAVAGELAPAVVDVALLERSGRPRWTFTRPGRGPFVRMAALGEAVLLGYEHMVEHRGEQRASRFERRLAYFSRDLNPSWTKGGAYSAPMFVAVDAGGRWVLALDTRLQVGQPQYRLYGQEGQRLWLYESPARVLISTSSVMGGYVASYRADETLELLSITPPAGPG